VRIGAQHLYDLGHRGTSPPPPNVDDAPWRWADASGEPLIINGLPAGPHKVLIELVNANHQTLDKGILTFVIP